MHEKGELKEGNRNGLILKIAQNEEDVMKNSHISYSDHSRTFLCYLHSLIFFKFLAGGSFSSHDATRLSPPFSQ